MHEAPLDDGHFLSSKQFGFRLCSSTQESLLSLTHGWHEVLDNGGSVLCVFLDLAKAFDSVPHQRILICLHDVGVKDMLLSWFHNYLPGLSQFVGVEGGSSAEVAVTSGVPQGSVKISGPHISLQFACIPNVFLVVSTAPSTLRVPSIWSHLQGCCVASLGVRI